MKRLLIILFIGVSILSLYSFECGTDKGCITFKSKFNQNFYILDTLNSTYKYYKIVSEDSNYVTGREICSGKINNTDSSLIIHPSDESYVTGYIEISYSKNVRKGTTEIILFHSAFNNLVRNVNINFYGNDSDCIIYEDVSFSGDLNVFGISHKKNKSIETINFPMVIDAFKICYLNGCTPLILLKDTGIRQKRYKKDILAYVDWYKPKKGKQQYNHVFIELRSYNYCNGDKYHWANKDSLEIFMGTSLTPGSYQVVMTREKRRVLTFNDK